MSVKLWVPIVGSGTLDDPYRPDVPAGLAWTTNDGIPTDMRTGAPATTHCEIVVADHDMDKVKSAVKADKVADKDKLLVALYQHCRHDVEAKADAFIAAKSAGVSAATIKAVSDHAAAYVAFDKARKADMEKAIETPLAEGVKDGR